MSSLDTDWITKKNEMKRAHEIVMAIIYAQFNKVLISLFLMFSGVNPVKMLYTQVLVNAFNNSRIAHLSKGTLYLENALNRS